MSNAQRAYIVGKFGDVNAAIKLIAELKGLFNDPRGRKPHEKSPNKGEEGYGDDASDIEGPKETTWRDRLARIGGTDQRDGASARDITPRGADDGTRADDEGEPEEEDAA